MSLRIGICDSGIGGLSVLRALYTTVSAEYVYIGDSLRAPYGNKSNQELLTYTYDLLSFLKSKEVDVYVSACNSISTIDTHLLLEKLGIDKKQYFDMRDFAESAKEELSKDAKLLIYGTVATISTSVYQEVFKEWNPATLSSSGLAFAIETNNLVEIDEEVDRLVDEVSAKGITHIFLACTHYPLIQEYFDKRFDGLGVTFIDPAMYIPKDLKEMTGEVGVVQIFTTKESNQFEMYLEDVEHTGPLVVAPF